jgi:hypothetical protein
LGDNQRETLLTFIDKNASLRKKINMAPGICEKIEDGLFNESLTEADEKTETLILNQSNKSSRDDDLDSDSGSWRGDAGTIQCF